MEQELCREGSLKRRVLTILLSSRQILCVCLGFTFRWYSTTFGMFGGLETTEEAGEDEEAVAGRWGTTFPVSVAPNNGAVITDLCPLTVSPVWQI